MSPLRASSQRCRNRRQLPDSRVLVLIETAPSSDLHRLGNLYPRCTHAHAHTLARFHQDSKMRVDMHEHLHSRTGSTHIHTHARTHARTHTCTHTPHTRTRAHTHAHTRTHTRMHARTHPHALVHRHIHTYLHAHLTNVLFTPFVCFQYSHRIGIPSSCETMYTPS